MRAKFNKLISVLCVVLVCSLFCGCEASIDLYDMQDEDAWYFDLDVTLSEELDSALKKSATDSVKHGHKWKVGEWLNDYFAVTSRLFGYTYLYKGEYTLSGGKKTYSFTDITVPKARTEQNAHIVDGLTYDSEPQVTTNLFVRTINVVRDDRYNFWVRSLEDEIAKGDGGEGASTLMGIILYGVGYYTAVDGETVYVEELPAFTKAFGVKLDGYTEIMLTDFWYASAKMNVNTRYRPIATNGGGAFYIFDKTVGDGDTEVAYEYYRADPTGWYIVAAALGGATVGIVILLAYLKKRRELKKMRPKTRDEFPYDPFGGDVDPFA